MSEWFPQVVQIEKIEKHPNADNLSIATVLGDYPVIVKTGEYQVGDLAAYLPIDSIVPDLEFWHFLCPKNYEQYEENGVVKQRQTGPKYPVGQIPERFRVLKAKKIRNVFSMGMLAALPDPPPNEFPDSCTQRWKVGDSVIEEFQLTKWEEEQEENIPNMPKTRGGNAASPPKGWSIPYYDKEGLRKYISCLQPGEEIVLSEKLNGSNASFCHDGENLVCKSRNWYKKFDPDDMWVDIAIRYDLENKLKQHPFLVFFGEIVGQVKNFRYDAVIENGKLLTKIYFFDVYDVKSNRYLDYDDRVNLIKSLGLDPVPELYRGPWTNKEEMYQYAEGKSVLNPKCIREGFVLNTLKERFEPRLNSRLSVKLIGEGYNLQK